jgi:hypothetical protein
MPKPRNREFAWFEKHFEEITEQDLRAAFESEDNSAENFLILTKMHCAKKGMTNNEWEEIFCEEKRRQSLTHFGVSEHFITKIIASLVQVVFGGIKGQKRDFLSIDHERRELKCSCPMCPEKPYDVITITREKPGSGIMDAIVVVLCKEHYTRVERLDRKLMDTIAEAATRQSSSNYSSWFERHLDDITAEDLIKALESEEIRSSPKDFLILAKMLCAKKGMSHKEWEELLHEQKKRQSLRQMGISEDFVTEIVGSLIQAMFQGINGQIGPFLSFDERRELKCSICPEKPYRAWTIMRAKQGSDIYDAIVAVLCKEHFKRVAVRPDIKLIHTIAEAAMQSRQQV